MKIIIIGGGKVGTKISEELSLEDHDVTVIEKNTDVINRIKVYQDIACINGNGINYDILTEAGAENADLVIGCTSSDEINMFSCLLAKKIGAKKTVARVRDPELHNQLSYIKDDLGLDMVINPELVAANEISRILRFPSAIKVETFAKGKVELLEFKVYEDCPLVGMAMNQIAKSFKIKVLICAIQRGENVFIPGGDTVIEEKDKLSIVASHEDLEYFLKKIGGLRRDIKSVMIVGGSKIAYYLCKSLENININIKIIERDIEACKKISALLPNVQVIHGDGTDQQLLEEEGLEEAEAFVTLTGIDEENILLSMYANTKDISKIITKVSQSTFQKMIYNFDLDTIISPKDITGTLIVRYVRAMDNSFGSKLNSMYRIVDDKVEVLEFTVNEHGKAIGKKLKDLAIKKDLLVACIVRKGKVIIPNGETTIENGDNVIIVTSYLDILEINDIVE